MSRPAQVTVQARDGRWHFGPASLEESMRADSHGAYATAADATQASTRETVEDPEATSLAARRAAQSQERT